MTLEELRRQTGIVIPVYFQPAVDETKIRQVLEAALVQRELFCATENTLLVVDRGTAAERVIQNAPAGSPLGGLPCETVERNQGKTGAIRAGLDRMLRESQVEFLVSRDCDGDGALEDLPHLVGLARAMREMGAAVAVFGVRASLARPMNWEREQWERLTNCVVEAIVDFGLALRRQVQDRTFWNGHQLDLQGGFRVYSRDGAELALNALQRVPDDPELYLLANEIVPYLEISFHGGKIGQLQRKTVVEQPISSFSRLPFPLCYGRLLTFLATQSGVPAEVLLQMFDNALADLPGYFSQLRESFLECRSHLDPQAPPPQFPGFI